MKTPDYIIVSLRRKKHSSKLLLLIFLLPLQAFAQDLTGVWTGYLQTAGTRLHYELAITEKNDKFGGYALTVFIIEGVENTGVKTIKLKNKKGKISFEDDVLVYNNYTTPPKRVVLFANLYLKIADSLMFLDGSFSTKSLDMRNPAKNLYNGTIHLQKKNSISTSKLISKLDEMKLLNTLSFIPSKLNEKGSALPGKKKSPPVTGITPPKKDSAGIPAVQPPVKPIPGINTDNAATNITKRTTEILTSIYYSSDSLTISLYDNGQIDGDTVSVMLNNKIIISKKGLTAKAITETINLSFFPGDSLVLVMYAENLGTIPPNTGLLILQDGDARHEIRFAGDFQKNSAIVLRRKR